MGSRAVLEPLVVLGVHAGQFDRFAVDEHVRHPTGCLQRRVGGDDNVRPLSRFDGPHTIINAENLRRAERERALRPFAWQPVRDRHSRHRTEIVGVLDATATEAKSHTGTIQRRGASIYAVPRFELVARVAKRSG